MSKDHDTPAWLRAIQRDGGPIAEGRPRVLDERGAIQPKLDEIAREARKRACEATQWHHEQGDSAPFQSRAVPLREAGSARAPRAAGDPAERPEMGVAGSSLDGWLRDEGMPGMADPIVAKTCALLLSRSAVGIAKYGVTLARTDLSRKQWLVHARDEALDMALYLQRLIDMEGEAQCDTNGAHGT
jgi:hypothetical protein